MLRRSRTARSIAPSASSLALLLAEHIRRFPPVPVTLPWKVPDGDLLRLRLLVTRPDGRPWGGRASIKPTGIERSRSRGHARQGAGGEAEGGSWQGTHVLRHTAASAWLGADADIVAVAAWLGDTVETVYRTYAHLMPDADDRGRKAMDQFFRTADEEGSALNVPSGRTD